MRLFSFLIDAVFPPGETAVVVRNTAVLDILRRIDPVSLQPNGHEIIGLFPYKDVVIQSCILEAKFHANKKAAQLLGAALSEFLFGYCAECEALEDISRVHIVPVPLSAERLSERGYNQTERIVRSSMEHIPGIRISPELVIRTRSTKPQTTLSGAERRENIQGAFLAPHSLNPEHTYILVDDVVTTGSTLHEAVEALRTAGAKHIVALALAY